MEESREGNPRSHALNSQAPAYPARQTVSQSVGRQTRRKIGRSGPHQSVRRSVRVSLTQYQTNLVNSDGLLGDWERLTAGGNLNDVVYLISLLF